MQITTLSDEELAALLARRLASSGSSPILESNGQGDAASVATEALAVLYDRYFRQSFALSVRMLANPAHAEEVVQEVFLKLWQAPHGFDQQRGRFASWLLSVVHHRCIDELRKSKRYFTVTSNASDEGDDLLSRIPDERNGPEEISWLNQQRSSVRAALARLTDVQRKVIELAYFGGMTQAEIATYLNEPLGTVKTRIRLGLQKMKVMLEAEGLEVG